MKILIDSLSTQALYQQKPAVLPPDADNFPAATGYRLNTVLGAMQSAGMTTQAWDVAYSTYPITAQQLEGVDVYLSFTRYPTTPFAYLPAELSALQAWVNGGGGILLMTNHGAFQGQNVNWSTNDAALAAQFGVTLSPLAVSANGLMEMPILPVAPAYIGSLVHSIASHDSCVMSPAGEFTVLAEFPAGATAYDAATGKTIAPPTPYFSLLVPAGKGNVIVVGNSGMFGDYGTPRPSCGMVPMAHNLLFFINAIGYLGGLKTPPKPGQCPS